MSGEMHAGDLLNLDMLKEAIEQPFEGFLWGQSRGMMTPYVCEAVFGDGLHLLTITTINQRPNYWVIRADSGWRESRRNWRADRDDQTGEHIDDCLNAIEDECGYAYTLLDEECPICMDECCRCDFDADEQFPALDDDTGCSWGAIRWPWLMDAIGYTAMLDRLSPPRIQAGEEGK